MFGAFTILFLLWYVVMIIWDSFYDRHVKIAEMLIKRVDADPIRKKMISAHIFQQSLIFVVVLIMVIASFIYFGFAIKHDTYVYPTLLLTVWNLYVIIRGLIINHKGNKHNVNTLEGAQANLARVKRLHAQSFRRTVINSLHVLYFAYMFGMLLI